MGILMLCPPLKAAAGGGGGGGGGATLEPVARTVQVGIPNFGQSGAQICVGIWLYSTGAMEVYYALNHLGQPEGGGGWDRQPEVVIFSGAWARPVGAGVGASFWVTGHGVAGQWRTNLYDLDTPLPLNVLKAFESEMYDIIYTSDEAIDVTINLSFAGNSSGTPVLGSGDVRLRLTQSPGVEFQN